MKVRAITDKKEGETGLFDWVFCRGLTAYKTAQPAIIQDIKTALYEFQNDCYFALDSGIDWLTRLGYHSQKDLLDRDVQSIINDRYGVLSIANFNSNVVGRSYQMNCDVYTIYSQDTYRLSYSTEI